MEELETLLLKLYFVYSIQRQGLNHLLKILHDGGKQNLVLLNTAYVASLLSAQQRALWPSWIQDIDSPQMSGYAQLLESKHGVIRDIPPSTHLEEYVPETKTVLILEN